MRSPQAADDSSDQESKHARNEPLLGGLASPDKRLRRSWIESVTPQTVLLSAVFTVACLGALRLYKNHLRRIPTVAYIKPELYRRKSLFGRVTSVGDGDNFRLFHTPGGRLAGWGWFPGRRVPTRKEELVSQTIHIRIAGVDAPEAAHFGKPSQPYSAEALAWLTAYVGGRRVRAQIWRRDQYERVVATVYVRLFGFWRRDVGLEMLKRGLATVYEARRGAEFGANEAQYRKAEQRARERRVGMWAEPSRLKRYLSAAPPTIVETPREYKNRTAMQTTSTTRKA